jgi:seryl-tRNA synthetase
MLDIQFIRDNKELVQENATKKGRTVDIDALLKLDEERRELLVKVEDFNSLKNDINDLIAQAKTDEERAEIIAKGKEIKTDLEKVTPELQAKEEAYQELIKQVPNIASADTPVGKDDSENVEIRTNGTIPEFSFPPESHDEIGRILGIFDSETAAKVTGARFAYVKGDLVKLQFALIQFVLDTVTNSETLQAIAEKNGLHVTAKPFSPVLPPVFIRPEVLDKMDRLEPKEDRYHVAEDDLYLTGSAEHTLGPIHMDQIIPESELPIRYIGYGTAFRREAGTYGKDTKGLIRMHQFDKLEMESFTTAEMGLDEQNFIVAIQEHLLQQLELPYQVMQVCTGDMGKPDARQIDINTWFPAQNTYRETHTSDYMTDYQSRRLMIRTRRENSAIEYVHMNDATAFALGRILAAIIENNQSADKGIRIPTVLQKWVGKEKIVGKE